MTDTEQALIDIHTLLVNHKWYSCHRLPELKDKATKWIAQYGPLVFELQYGAPVPESAETAVEAIETEEGDVVVPELVPPPESPTTEAAVLTPNQGEVLVEESQTVEAPRVIPVVEEPLAIEEAAEEVPVTTIAVDPATEAAEVLAPARVSPHDSALIVDL